MDEAEEIDIESLWEQLRGQGEVEDDANFADFLHADLNLATTGTRTLEEIAESVQVQTIELESEDEMTEIEVQQPPITRQAAYKGFDQLRRYVEENATDPKVVQACHIFEDFLYQEQSKKSIQAPVTQFLQAEKSTQSSINQFFM